MNKSGGSVKANTSRFQREEAGSTPANRIVFYNVTWKEFQKIIQILRDYQKKFPFSEVSIENILETLSKVKKQHYNIKIDDFDREGFNIIIDIMNAWNVIKNPLGTKELIHYDKECETINAKLQKAYHKLYKVQALGDRKSINNPRKEEKPTTKATFDKMIEAILFIINVLVWLIISPIFWILGKTIMKKEKESEDG